MNFDVPQAYTLLSRFIPEVSRIPLGVLKAVGSWGDCFRYLVERVTACRAYFSKSLSSTYDADIREDLAA